MAALITVFGLLPPEPVYVTVSNNCVATPDPGVDKSEVKSVLNNVGVEVNVSVLPTAMSVPLAYCQVGVTVTAQPAAVLLLEA